ncbi:MAG: rod shape-determining protein MreD [Alphaproteobacteria bacterium]|nr:rod shape-determining protein MreD [Alphaproteobacteria bacterium]
MREDLDEFIGSLSVKILPLFMSVLWLIAARIPLHSEIFANARPLAGLMCVYFWSLYRPDLFGLVSVLILGITADILSLAPFGLYLFIYLIQYLIVVNSAKYAGDKTFETAWLGICITMLPALFAGWLLASVYYAFLLPLKGLFFSYLLSVALYPILGGANAFMLNVLMKDEEL